MFSLSSTLLMLISIVALPSHVQCSKFGKKIGQKASTTPPPSFGGLDLQKRPLNFYVVANGKHAQVQNKSLANNTNTPGNSSSRTTIPVEYRKNGKFNC